ncbi:KAP family P-loop domain protein [Sulfitobacter sp. THAF37]|uniref:KAP family P-loop NTPase fold protein n=1 Tax=Sulfitobacter sp. THAF37 TaxID=2587855 RepID=UPI0012694D58|nr:P-loop NTPase fold protein [Sulfitobacter sp. THAF37]QFT58091.1 KAP family P-loop domain protein [Sulfitobacter sp. THAF37]
MGNFDDIPITSPDSDRFGFDPFASAISDCIRSIENPLGSVAAIYGPWGSGKSSVINLVRHHLAKDAPDLDVINFPAWMYRTEDALAVGFFKELYAGLSPVLSDQTKAAGALRKLGANLAGASSLAGMAVGLFAGSVGEKATTATLDALGGFIEQGEAAEDLQATLADALREAGKKFLVVIDDLDRLSPEEALVIFRLVKSVGRLPNVMYLLAYDREATEQAVARRFPSEGAHYLEKIIQAGFELPQPDQSHLNVMMGEVLNGLAADLPEIDPVEFGNLFHSIVAPELKTPRDVFRLANTISITITPIKSDVFFPDFVSLETLRVFRPAVYRAIRQNKSAILNAGQNDRYDQRETRSAQYTSMLLRSESEEDHEHLRDALMRLFPQLQNVFANMSYSGTREWARQRRVCSAEHFDTYFRFSVSPKTIPKAELDYLIDDTRTVKEIQDRVREAVSITQAEGRTKASYILDELTAHGLNISLDQGEKLLSALFGMADELFLEQDEGRGFASFGNNRLRLHWLLRSILLDRTTLHERTEILTRSIEGATLQWHLDISNDAWQDYHPSNPDSEPSSEAETLTTHVAAERLQARSLELLRAAAASDTILSAKTPARLLYDWDRLQPDGAVEVMNYITRALGDDTKLCQLASAFLGKSYSHGMGGFGGAPGDLVQRENDRAQVDGIDRLLDVDEFRRRLNEALGSDGLDEQQKSTISRFLVAWERRDAGED